jgi:hypothetical protein
MPLNDAQFMLKQQLCYVAPTITIDGRLDSCLGLFYDTIVAGRFTCLTFRSMHNDELEIVFRALMSPTNRVVSLVIESNWDIISPHLMAALSSPHCALTHVCIAINFTHESIIPFIFYLAQGLCSLTVLTFGTNVLSYIRTILVVLGDSRHKLRSVNFNHGLAMSAAQEATFWSTLYSPSCRLMSIKCPSLGTQKLAWWMRYQAKKETMLSLLHSVVLRSTSPLKRLPVCMFRKLYTY